MSTYDERIVRLGFDNAKFEAGASKSMSTLDKLNEKLKFKDAQKGTQELQRSVDNVDFSSMARAIDNIERRFSAMGIAGMNVINQITNGIIGSVKQLEQATIGQIKSGGWARAMNIANAKFQIEGLGFAWEQIEKAVSYGVKDTAYGLDAAASAASQLAASGVDFQKSLETVNGQDLTAMHKSLRAISGVAAMTNSSYEDIARIFTTVAGNGRLMGDQLLQLSSRGMNAAAKLGEAMGKTEAEIRDMVSHGQIDFQTFAFAMDDAFGQHAKEANKTFTGALSNMKAALSRVGEIFADPVINKTNTLFIALTERIDEFKNKLKSVKVPNSLKEIKKRYDGISLSAAAYDAILKANSEKTVTFGKHFAEMWQSGIDAFSAMIRAVDIGWFDKIVEKVDSVTVKVKEFFDLIKDAYTEDVESTADAVSDATKSLKVSAEEAQAAKDIIQKGMYGAGAARQKALQELFGGGEEGAQHAKNVQTYIDSVVAANYDFEKATIKVTDANEELADSQKQVEKANKKAKLKAVLDSIRTSMNNLLDAAKNIITAAKKIASAIMTAFTAVFKMDFTKTSKGVVGFTELIVELSKKLIISNDTAKRITSVFTIFFSVVKKGIDILQKAAHYVVEFVKSIGESKTFSTIGDYVGALIDKFVSLAENLDLDDNPILTFLTSVVDAIGEFITGRGDIPSKLTVFVNSVIDSVTSIKWGEFAKFGAAAFAVYSIAKFVYAVKALGGIIAGIANLPGNIGGFFFKLGNAVRYAGDVYVIISVAKSLAIVAGALVVLSQVNDQDLYKAIGTLIIISLVMKFLMKAAGSISLANSTSVVGIASEVSYVLSMVKVVYSVATMVLAVAAALTIISVGAAIIKRSGAADGTVFATIVGIMSAIILVTVAMTKLLGKVDMRSTLMFPTVMGALSLFLVAASVAILGIAGAMAILNSVNDKLFTFGILIAMFEGMRVILKTVAGVEPSRLLAASVTIAAVGAAVGVLFTGISYATTIVADAVNKLGKFEGDLSSSLLSVFGLLSALFLMVTGITALLTANARSVSSGVQITGSLLAASAMFVAMGFAIHIIVSALNNMATLDGATIGATMTTIGIIFGGMITLMYMTSSINAAVMLGSALLFVSMASAVLMISGAIALLSNYGSDNMWEAAVAVFIAIMGVGSAMALAAAALSEAAPSAVLFIGGLVAVTALITAISLALARIGNINNIVESAVALGVATVAFGMVLAFLTAVTGESKVKADAMLGIGAAFIMIAGSLLILAMAMEKIGEIDASALTTAGIAFAVIAGALLALSIAGAFIPKFAETMSAVGIAFLSVGLSAALVGAGIYLVAAAVKVLAPAIGVMAISLEAMFTVLENHKAAAITVGIITLALIVAITAAIIKLSPILKSAAEVISNFAKKIGSTITGGVTRLKGWFDTFTIRGKAAIVSLIAMLCGAIMKASPQMLDTVGKLIIKLLAYLGSIAGDVAQGLLEFVINLVNGLADAIRANSARIAAALWGVVISLVDVLMQIIGQILNLIISPISQEFADSITESVTEQSKALNDYALAQRRLAEASDKDKQEYIDSINAAAKATEDASDRTNSALGGVTSWLKQNTTEQKSELESLKEEYSGLPGYAYDAILRSKQSQASASGKAGSATGSSFLSGLTDGIQNGNSEFDMESLMGESGWSAEGMGDYGSMLGGEFSDANLNELAVPSEYYDAQSDNMENGTVKAIEDSKDDVKKAIKENVNDPANITIRSSRQSYYDAGVYCVQGLVQAVKDDTTYVQAMVKLARDGKLAFDTELDIESPSKVFYKNGEYIVAGLVNGLEASSPRAINEMSSVGESLIEHFSEPVENLSSKAYYSASSKLIDGFAQAVKDNMTYSDALSELSESGTQAFISGFKMEIPTDQYYANGKSLVSGVVAGIDENTYRVSDSVEGLNQAIITAFGDPIAYCSKIASGELTYVPRIRPVVDSSSISGSAASIGAMFDNQAISINGVSGRLAADIGTLDQSNMAVVNELRELRADMAMMTEQIANMQMVMDTGALVGQISGPIDRELGRRAVFRGRGN